MPKAWSLYVQSKEWNKAPSEILAIEDTYHAYCLNEAIWWFGKYVEDKVKEAGKSRGKSDNEKKQTHRAETEFRRILGMTARFQSTPEGPNG